MNALDYPNGLTSFKTQLSIMCMSYLSFVHFIAPSSESLALLTIPIVEVPISLALTIISCVLAFSKVTRAFLFYVLSVSWCWVITKLPFYVAWKEIGYNSRYFKYEQKVKRTKMKEAALQRQRDKVLQRRHAEV